MLAYIVTKYNTLDNKYDSIISTACGKANENSHKNVIENALNLINWNHFDVKSVTMKHDITKNVQNQFFSLFLHKFGKRFLDFGHF